MGVDNLWTLVAPKGRKLKLAALEGKVVAIDSSMWMYQFARTMVDPETGEPLPGAHVLGFFRRICKLLMLRIKPIFVFDGPPPALKMQTLRERKDETISIKRRTKLLAAQIVKNALAGGRRPLIPQEPELISSESSSDAEEIYDLDPSDDERTFRMTVPAAFRGFAAERRSLDEIRFAPSSSTPPKNRLNTQVDLEKVTALPGKDAYRELRKLQANLLQEGRDWAQGSQGSNVQDFSDTQTRVFLQRSNVAQLISDSRKRMAVEENLKPVSEEPPVKILKPRRRGALDEDLFKDPVTFPSKLSRDDLLFGKLEKKEEKFEMPKLEEDDEVDVAALFGDGWNEAQPVMNIPVFADSISSDEGEIESVSSKDDFPLHARSPPTEKTVMNIPVVDEEQISQSETEEEILVSSDDDEIQSVISSVDSPVHAAQPTAPVHAAQPMSPVPAPPVHAAQSTEPVHAAQPSSPVHAPPVHAAQPTAPVHAAQPSSPVHAPPVHAAQPTEPVHAAQPSSPVHAAQPTEPVHAAQPTEPVHAPPVPAPKPTEPVHAPPVHAAQSAPPVHATQPQSQLEIHDDFERLLESDLLDERNFETDDVWLEQELRKMALSGAEVDQTAFQEDIQELLAVFGIPWIRAPAEAEAQCCFLASHGLADAVISDDSDCLVFGTPIVLRHLYFGELTVQAFYHSSLGFSQNQLKSLALLLGCDYTSGVYGIGIVNGAEIVKVYDGIEGLVRFHQWAIRFHSEGKGKEADPVDGEDDSAELRAFKDQHKKLRSGWQFPAGFPSLAVWEAFTSPVVDVSGDSFDWGSPVEDAIVNMMKKHTTLQEDRVRELLSPTLKRYSETSVQRKITDFFSPSFDCGPVGEFASSRLKKAVK